jgi:hypothetical protein
MASGSKLTGKLCLKGVAWIFWKEGIALKPAFKAVGFQQMLRHMEV